MRAKIRDTEIFFDVEGLALVADGNQLLSKPVAFLVHGGPGADHTVYKPAFSALSNQAQLIYLDLRGQGRSARGPKETYTLENNVEDLEALRQYLGLEKIALIGASYGGMVALSYAVRYPQNLSHLIAITTAPDFRFFHKAQETLQQQGTEEQKAIAKRVWEGTFENEAQMLKYWQVMMPMYSLIFRAHPQLEASYLGIPSHEAVNVAFSGFLRSYNVLDELPKITAPTLVIGARHDWFCAPEFSEDIANAIPNSELKIFENSGHAIAADEPQAMLDAIANFLAPKH